MKFYKFLTLKDKIIYKTIVDHCKPKQQTEKKKHESLAILTF